MKRRNNASQSRLILANSGRRPSSAELAQRAFDLRFEDAFEALAFAELAVEQAASETKENQAFAHAHLGNTRRLIGDFVGAKTALLRAQELYITPNPLVLSFQASLHKDQRELLEAQSCLAEASSLVTDRNLRGKLLLKSAYVVDLSGHSRTAAGIVAKALDLLDDPAYVAAAIQSLSVYLTNAGEVVEALAVLREGAPALSILGELGQLHVTWLEGKIAAACDHHEAALVKLCEARRGFADAGLDQEAALLSLEVSLSTARLGRFWSAKEQLQGVREVLSILGIDSENLAASVLYRALQARTLSNFLADVSELHGLIAAWPKPRRAS